MSEQMGVFDVMHNCRAMRRLKPDPVPEELLVELVDAANHGPSGSNRQMARWLIVRDSEQKRKLAALNLESVEHYISPQSSRPMELPHQSIEKRKRMLDAVLWQAQHFEDIPAVIVACIEFAQPPTELEAAKAGGSVWPGVQNLLLAARALGLGATPTTLALVRRQAFKEALEIPEGVEPYCLIPVGYPRGNFGPVARIPARETIHWDRW